MNIINIVMVSSLIRSAYTETDPQIYINCLLLSIILNYYVKSYAIPVLIQAKLLLSIASYGPILIIPVAICSILEYIYFDKVKHIATDVYKTVISHSLSFINVVTNRYFKSSGSENSQINGLSVALQLFSKFNANGSDNSSVKIEKKRTYIKLLYTLNGNNYVMYAPYSHNDIGKRFFSVDEIGNTVPMNFMHGSSPAGMSPKSMGLNKVIVKDILDENIMESYEKDDIIGSYFS